MDFISIEKLQDAVNVINPDTEVLCAKVTTLINSGLTLAQALVRIADEQRPPRLSKVAA
jgi:type II secretory pathway component PulF